MRIDTTRFSGPCACGKEHTAVTKLCMIEPGALARLDTLMAESGLSGKRCAVYDANTYAAIPAELHPAAEQEILLPPSGLHADEHTTADLSAKLEGDVEVVLAIGGGPLHDIVRFCCKERGIPFVSIPTAASCDAFSAEVAAMTWEGVKRTINCQAPELVVADVNIIRAAPPHLILSGIGDVLGKFIALAEWRIAHAITGEAFCQPIYDMMHDALLQVWDNCLAAREGEPEAVAAVMQGLLLSGIAMQLFGSSRPASGAEHHISHLIDLRPVGLGPVRGASHGEQVGAGTILASREYHRIAALEDITDRIMPFEPVDQDWLRSYFGEDLYPATAAENEKDALRAASPLAILMAWPEIQEIVAEIPTAEELTKRLTALGAKTSLSDIGVPEEKLNEILDAAPYCRNRLTLMRLRRMIRN